MGPKGCQSFGMPVGSETEHGAEALLALAERLQERAPADALVAAGGAARLASLSGLAELALRAERSAGRLSYELGDRGRAAEHFARARTAARTLPDPVPAARLDLSLAFLAYDRGQPVEAEALLDASAEAIAALPSQHEGARRVRALLAGYRGNLARQAGALDEARRHYRAALSIASAEGGEVPRATFLMDLGAAELAGGALAVAAGRLEQAGREVDALAPGSARSLLVPLVLHYRALHALAAGADAPIELPGAPSLQAIRVWLHDARRAPSIGAALRRRLARLRDEAVGYEHARFGVELVSVLGRVALDTKVRVARDGSLIVRGPTVADLSAREPLRRVLEALLRARATGDALPLEALVTAGWPGEKIHAAAAKNRAHVALSTLRALGLGAALRRDARGYALDPSEVEPL